MASSIKLRVQWAPGTLDRFAQNGIDLVWDSNMQHDFVRVKYPVSLMDACDIIEALAQDAYQKQTQGRDEIQMQVSSLYSPRAPEKPLRLEDPVNRHFKPGDTILVLAQIATPQSAAKRRKMQELRQTQIEIRKKQVEKQLRFDINDQVLCYCGTRHLSGHIVGKAVLDDGQILPYLVKTDPRPGLESSTISVPGDNDDTCQLDVCFDPHAELDLVKAAAAVIPQSSRGKLRFAVGENVVCRIRNISNDGLELWVPGSVSRTWAKLPGKQVWELGDISGSYPDAVPYKVDLGSGKWIFCHRDAHTLIRRKGMQPQHRVRGTSKRMEVRTAQDGSREKIDHGTERRKPLACFDSSSESDV